jgi:sigma-B regulation protein RsbU (phosphoserine phosphatase)
MMIHREIDSQINDTGAKVVNALAAVDFDYWQAVADAKKSEQEIYLVRKGNPEERIPLKDNPLKEAISLDSLPTPGIIKAVIVKGGISRAESKNVETLLTYDAVPGTGTELKFSDEAPYNNTGVLITEGFFTESSETGRGETYPVRQFRKPIVNSRGYERGNAIIFLSAAEIQQTTQRFVVGVAIVCIIALVVATLFSLLLSAMVTQPAGRLVRDMNAVAQGDLDHKALGYGGDEIGALALAFNRMTAGLKAAQQREIERRAFERELSIATEIQAALLPTEIPKIHSFDIGAIYRPAKEVGGDYYDYIPVDEAHTGFIIADVSGKGIPGSMVMTMVRSLLRYEASGNTSAVNTLRNANRILARDIKKGMFVTAFYIIVEHATGRIRLSCAGHNPVLYWQAKTATVREVKPEGLALGVASGPSFDESILEVAIDMGAGDRVVMYTDGVTEAMDKNGKEFGVQHLARLMSEYRSESADSFAKKVLEHVTAHATGVEQHDDITFVNFVCRGHV